MKIAKGLIPLLVLIFAVSMIIGCSHSDKSDVEGVITNELNLLKNLDGALLGDLLHTLHELLALHGVLLLNAGKVLRREGGDRRAGSAPRRK